MELDLGKRGCALVLALALLALLAVPAPRAHAQLRRPTSGVAMPGEATTAPTDALGIDLNPAALAFLESWSLLYLHADAAADGSLPDRGDALWGAVPLPFGLALGASAQSIRPTLSTLSMDNPARGLGELSLAWAPSRSLAFGTTLRFVASQDGLVDGLTSLDLAATWRPIGWLALAAIAHDVTAPGLGYGGRAVPRSLVLGAALRPFGTDVLTLDFAVAADADGRVAGRGTLGARVPWLGRLLVAAEAEHLGDADEDLRVIAGVNADWGTLGVGGGAIIDADNPSPPGVYVSAHLDGVARRGLPVGRRIQDVSISGVSSRSIVRTTVELERALDDERVVGVLLRMRSGGLGLAYAQELRMAIARLVAAGKPVVCHLDSGTGSEMYACAGATRTLVDPAGGIRLIGPSQEILLLGDVLRTIGLRADFVRIGEFKSAPEQLSNHALSSPARLADDVMLSDVYARFVGDLSTDMHIPRARVRRIVDAGPFLAEEARSLGLVDGLADELALEDSLEEAFGGSYGLAPAPGTRTPPRWGTPARIGVVMIDGNIVDGESVDVPFIDIHLTGGRTVSDAIDALAADPATRAIVVRIDSPGGSALASDQIWRAIRRARQRKPVIASLGAIAASGGYYAASACQEIWADPSTLTGSIGIFYGKVDGGELAARLGVSIEVLTRGRHAAMESIYQPFTPEERALLADKIREFYRMFLRRVAVGRGMTLTAVDRVARGRIWSGDAALARHLVDRLGGLGAALVRARTLGGLDRTADIVVVPRRPEALLDYVLGGFSTSAQAGDDLRALEPPASANASPLAALPSDFRRLAAASYTIATLRPGAPLALMLEQVELR